MDIDAYSATLTGVQLVRGSGEVPLTFLKIEESVLILKKKVRIVSIFGLNIPLKM